MSNRPLYQQARRDFPPPDRIHRHTGLWHERFFDRFEADWGINSEASGQWIRTLEGPCIDRPTLQSQLLRHYALTQARQAQVQAYRNDWRLVTGMGREHPAENGFTWHPTLGIPYLPGSSVKGLLRGWMEAWYDGDDRDQRIQSWFGGDPGSASETAGSLIFFDALPLSPPSLAADIMTPHMGQWYAEGERIDAVPQDHQRIPGDWHQPNPVTFLVCERPVMLFAIAPRHPKASDQLQPAFEQLTLALEMLGAGAKTAAGYGRMHPDPNNPILGELEKSHQQQQQQASQTRQQQADARAEAAMSDEEKILHQMEQALEQRQGKIHTDPALKDATRRELKQLLETAEGWQDPALRQRAAQCLTQGYAMVGHVNRNSGKRLKKRIEALHS
jgi:CRISPR-associated protein Cmr6